MTVVDMFEPGARSLGLHRRPAPVDRPGKRNRTVRLRGAGPDPGNSGCRSMAAAMRPDGATRLVIAAAVDEQVEVQLTLHRGILAVASRPVVEWEDERRKEPMSRQSLRQESRNRIFPSPDGQPHGEDIVRSTASRFTEGGAFQPCVEVKTAGGQRPTRAISTPGRKFPRPPCC
jgi:hypothetical protein